MKQEEATKPKPLDAEGILRLLRMMHHGNIDPIYNRIIKVRSDSKFQIIKDNVWQTLSAFEGKVAGCCYIKDPRTAKSFSALLVRVDQDTLEIPYFLLLWDKVQIFIDLD